MAAKTSKALKVRYGKAQGALTAEDIADLKIVEARLRRLRPEMLLTSEEVRQHLGLK